MDRDLKNTEVIFYLVDYNPNSKLKTKMISKARELPFADQIRIVDGGLAMWGLILKPLA